MYTKRRAANGCSVDSGEHAAQGRYIQAARTIAAARDGGDVIKSRTRDAALLGNRFSVLVERV